MRVRTLSSAIIVGVMLFVPGGRVAHPSSTPSQADFEECNRVAQTKLNPLTTDSSSDSPARRSRWPRKKAQAPPPPAVAPDPTDPSLRGMHDVGFRNEHYRKAYRECMTERGVSESAGRE